MSNLKLKAYPTNWDEANDFLGDKEYDVLGHNTTIQRGGLADIFVTYHATPIVTYYENGDVFYRNGGYGTATTRNRLNMLSPDGVSFYQRDHAQYVSIDGIEYPFDRTRISPPTVDKAGVVFL